MLKLGSWRLEPSKDYNLKLRISKLQWPSLVQQNSQKASIYKVLDGKKKKKKILYACVLHSFKIFILTLHIVSEIPRQSQEINKEI